MTLSIAASLLKVAAIGAIILPKTSFSCVPRAPLLKYLIAVSGTNHPVRSISAHSSQDSPPLASRDRRHTLRRAACLLRHRRILELRSARTSDGCSTTPEKRSLPPPRRCHA